jgi:hypothetical protein
MKLRRFRFFCLPLFFAALGLPVFASGQKDEDTKQALNSEWILCVTGFNLSGLSEGRRSAAGVITRSLVDTFKDISYRVRVSPEYAYYEGYAWSQSRTAAAKALAAKQEERSQYLYRGEADWKYRRNMKRLDAEIEQLREAYTKTEENLPPVSREPVFGITSGNREGNFPEPPKEGGEYRFCQGQKADAFLSGTVREYHNRFFVTLRLYVVYTRSFVYEDSIIFSADDLPQAVEEIAGRLAAVLSGSRPAAVAVHAEPPETLVLINQTFAGRGELEAREHPPGKINITFSAPGHIGETVETELLPGELTEVSVNLRPMDYADVHIETGNRISANVYQGSLYVGEAPLTLRLPLNQLAYVNLETVPGPQAKAVFSTPAEIEQSYTFSLKLEKPPPDGRRVNNARKWYYWAWGGTWITGIAAWITLGMFNTTNYSIQYGHTNEGKYNQSFAEENLRMYYISWGAVIALGVAVGYEIFQMARYLYIATEDNTPVIRPRRRGAVKPVQPTGE